MNNESKNKIFDVLLTEALKEYMDIELNQINALAQSECCEFSDKFERKVHRIGNSIGRADRIKAFGKVVFRTVVSAAVAFGIVFGMLLTQPEVYAAVQKTIRTVFGEYDKIEYVDEAADDTVINDSIRLGYVPEGYYLSEGKYTPLDVSLIYKNGENRIKFEYGFANGKFAYIDNEQSWYEVLTSDGIEYHCYLSDDKSFYDKISWCESGYYFVVSAHISKEDIIKIAENIKK